MARALWLGLAGLGLAGAALAAGPGDDAEIRALEQRQATAWNAHDIDAYAALFSQDAEVVNVLGWHWHGRAELKQKLGCAFAAAFARSRLAIANVTIAFLTPDIAVAHVRWTMTGALSPTGTGIDKGIQMQVLMKQAGAWHITQFQNTNSVPEQAFAPPH